MGLIATVVAFMIVGGIARTVILIIQSVKSENSPFKPYEEPQSYRAFPKISLVFQGLWLFCAILITREYESSLLNLDTLTILIGLSMPVSAFYIIRWLCPMKIWPAWVLVLGSITQFLAVMSLGDVFRYHSIEDIIALMIIVFNAIYVSHNFPFLWNRLYEKLFKFSKLKENISSSCFVRKKVVQHIILIGGLLGIWAYVFVQYFEYGFPLHEKENSISHEIFDRLAKQPLTIQEFIANADDDKTVNDEVNIYDKILQKPLTVDGFIKNGDD